MPPPGRHALRESIGPDVDAFASYSFYGVMTAINGREIGSMKKRGPVGSAGDRSRGSASELARSRTTARSGPAASLLWSRLNENHKIWRKFRLKMTDLAAKARIFGIEPGYHDVFERWHAASEETQRRLMTALSQGRSPPVEFPPPGETLRAFQGDGRRYWLLAVQLYMLRSSRNWGHGDFGDLARVIPLAAARGAAGIGLNPLHALFIERAGEASPDVPNSRSSSIRSTSMSTPFRSFQAPRSLALTSAFFARRPHRSRAGPPAKLDGLRLAFEHFLTTAPEYRRADFDAYRREQGEQLRQFACFEVLRPRFAPSPWKDWPEPRRNPSRRICSTCGKKSAVNANSTNTCSGSPIVSWNGQGNCSPMWHAGRTLSRHRSGNSS